MGELLLVFIIPSLGGLDGCFQKIGVPKMDGENNGNPIEMYDLGGWVPLFLG